jgi:hypothetical protein
MIRRIALAAVLAAGAGAAEAADAFGPGAVFLPQPIVTGDLEVGLGIFRPDGGTDTGVFTTTGRANVPLQGSLNVQLQTTGTALFLDGMSMQWTDFYGHVWQRLPTTAWGLFGGTAFLGGMVHAAGAEAKVYLGNISLGGEAAYLWTSTGGTNAWEVAGAANMYLDPNTRIGAGIQHITGFASDYTAWNVDIEHRFAGSPWSVWGYFTSIDVAGTSSWAALAGFKWFMDAPNSTLQSHEQDVPFWFKSLIPVL